MKIEYWPIKKIKPYEKNPRKIDRAVDYVANSIKEFGFRVPIVIDRNGVIVAGHVRYRAAKRLKMDKLPCVIADDLTEEQVNQYRIIDNKTQELSRWNFQKLIDELEELTEKVDMKALGFNYGDDASEGSGETKQQIEAQEIDLGEFSDEMFTCTCPSCGFRFND